MKLELDKFENCLSRWNKAGRMLWSLVNMFFVRPAFPKQLWVWRRFWFRVFGAELDRKSYICSDAWIWAPWNLSMGAYSTLASGVKVYNTGHVFIGSQVTVSQGAYLCSGSHDISHPRFPMVCSEMILEDCVWVATEAFIGGRDVRIGEGAVVAARSVVSKDVSPWTVVAGNPARNVKNRVLVGE